MAMPINLQEPVDDMEARRDPVEDRLCEIRKDVREIRNWGLGAVAFLVTAFAIGYERLDQQMDTGFVRLEERMDERFIAMDERLDRRFNAIDQKFSAIDQKFDAMDQRFDAINQTLMSLQGEIKELSARLPPPAVPSSGTHRRER